MPLNIPGFAPKAATYDTFAQAVKGFVDGLETSLNALTTKVTDQGKVLATKYAKPALGIPASDLAAAVQAALTAAGLANLRELEWVNDLTLTRPDRDPKVKYLWVKRNPAHTDPPIDDTHVLSGVDLILRSF